METNFTGERISHDGKLESPDEDKVDVSIAGASAIPHQKSVQHEQQKKDSPGVLPV